MTERAAWLLSLVSLFDRQGIPESLLHDQYRGDEDGKTDFDDDIHTLTSFSLIEMSAGGREFEIHRPLELYNELKLWQATYAALMDERYLVGRPENWLVCLALFPHAQAVALVLFKAACKAHEMGSAAFQARETIFGAEHPDTLNNLSSQYSNAEVMHQRALEAKGRVLGSDHPSTLTSMANLASTYRNQGRWNDAEELEV
ncbi:hypothetical protein V2W45_1466061 [Cenococcum geophilum]